MDMARRLWFDGGRSLPPVGRVALVSIRGLGGADTRLVVFWIERGVRGIGTRGMNGII